MRSKHVVLTQPAHMYTYEVRLDVSLKATLPVDWAGFLLASYKAHAQTFMNTIALKLLSSSSICAMCSTVCLRQIPVTDMLVYSGLAGVSSRPNKSAMIQSLLVLSEAPTKADYSSGWFGSL